MEDHSLFQPLLSTSTTTAISDASTAAGTGGNHYEISNTSPSNNFNIILRILTVISIGMISLWANYEATKGFEISIKNDAGDTPAGKIFSLLYISNDKATRIVQTSSSLVENFLYPPNNTPAAAAAAKKQVRRVTLRLTRHHNVTDTFRVINDHEYVINVCSSLMSVSKYKRNPKALDDAFASVVLRGMARVWLYDGRAAAPAWLLDGAAEYISLLGGGGRERELLLLGPNCCLGGNKEEEVSHVGKCLEICERKEEGFIQRLNQDLKDKWKDDLTVENLIGMSCNYFCDWLSNRKKIY